MRTLLTTGLLPLLAVLLVASCVDPLLDPEPPLETTAALETTINRHRASIGLPPVTASPALRYVAQRHLEDLEREDPVDPCNLHSWSALDPDRSACCYDSVEDAPCMWSKPAELTNYPGKGYEIAVSIYGSDKPLSAERALEAWLDSPFHREVIEERGEWIGKDWRAMGGAIGRNHAVIWFGEEVDPLSEGDVSIFD